MRRVWGLGLVTMVMAFASLAAWGAEAGDPALPSDAEVTKFIGVWKALAADPGSASEVCAGVGDEGGDDGEDFDAAAIGKELEASPTLGPLLARQALSGRRFIEVSVHLFAGMLGLAIADELDSGQERAANREAVLRDSPAAKLVAAHQAELDPVMQRAQELCSEEEEEEEEEELEPEDDYEE